MSSIRIKEIVPLNSTLNVTSNGKVNIQNLTAATNTTGSLIIDGGVLISNADAGTSLTQPGGLYVNGGASINGNAYLNGIVKSLNSTSVTSTSSASFIMSGGLLVNDRIAFQNTYGPYVKNIASSPELLLSSLTSPSAPQGFALNIANPTSDGTYHSSIRVWAIGNNIGSTNQEYLQVGYDASSTSFILRSLANGSGAYRAIKLSGTNGISDQLQIGTDQTISLNTTMLQVLGTNDSSSTTTGSVVINGGLAVAKTLYTGGNIIIGNSTEDKLSKQTFTIQNNQSSALTIFTISTSKAFKLIGVVTVVRSSGGTLYETIDMVGYYQNSSTWSIYYTSTGDISGVSFQITSSGQLQYTSSNITNFTSATFGYRLYTAS